MTNRYKGPKKRRKKPEDCDHKNLTWTELDKNKERRRRAKKMAKVDQSWKKCLKNIRRGLSGLLGTAVCFARARKIEEEIKGDAWENHVAEETNAKWTDIEYKCPDCGLRGDIDVVTKDDIAKECKASAGLVKPSQYRKNIIAAKIIFGPTTQVHLAVPKGGKQEVLNKFSNKNEIEGKIQEH
ncbi:MAG: hypothetical protein SVR94_06390 [Pseudomonadota bacterium]|nr:hypothetical protein [Pseudomonadota bacterium]